MPTRIMIAEPKDFSSAALRQLQTAADVTLRELDRSELVGALNEFDVVWFRLAHRMDRAMLERPLRCRFLATPVTGLDHIDLAACAERGISVISLRGETEFLRERPRYGRIDGGTGVGAVRRVPAAAAHVREGGWNRDLFRGRELFGRTVGVVGVGRLGSQVAEYFRAFGMEVLGFDTRPDFPHPVAHKVDSLHALLSRSDVVSLHVSLDDTTRHMIGSAEFAAMKPGAVLNTVRGGVIDEEALLLALQSGRVAAPRWTSWKASRVSTASTGSFSMREHDHLLIVPHVGGNTVESFEKTEVFLATKVVDALRNEAH